MKETKSNLSDEYVTAQVEVPAVAPSGGDFQSAFPVQDGSGNVAVVIGDVTGHGPEQTAQADHMRELLSDCLEGGLSPAESLAAVNAMIEPDPNFEGFGTVFVGTLEPGTGKLTYSSGGHEPALIATPEADHEDAVEELEGSGPPVGAFPPEIAHYDEQQTTLPVGGTLLLYTDGVPDARPATDRKQYFGLSRLKAVLAQLAKLSPRKLIAGIFASVASFCQGKFHDDVAMLAVRRRKLDGTATASTKADPPSE